MPQRFFITHSWEDIDFTRKLYDDLKANGLDGFFDERSVRPGESIPSRIERGLEECDVYIPVFSPDALKSPWCDWEIDMAITMNRERNGRPHIIPVIAEECAVPSRLRSLLHINFVGRYDAALRQLLDGIGLRGAVIRTLPARKSFSAPLPILVGIGSAIVLLIVVAAIAFSANNPTPTPVALAPTVIPTRVAMTEPAVVVAAPTATSMNMPTAAPTTKLANAPTAAPTTKLANAPTAMPVSKLSPIDGATMVFVPAGEFTMGSNNGGEYERPAHTVYLDSFWIDKFEATNAQYRKCVDKGVCQVPQSASSDLQSSNFNNSQYNDLPIFNVTWNQAKAFCEWATKRLPTEAEWEKAARGTDERIWPWGNVFNKDFLNSQEGLRGNTTAVGSFPTGASPYGAMDMSGNVWEWVADWFAPDYYSKSPRENPTGPVAGLPQGKSKVIRGGAWNSSQILTWSFTRLYNFSVDRISTDGDIVEFRCATSLLR